MPPKKKVKLSKSDVKLLEGVAWSYKDGSKWLEYTKQDQLLLEKSYQDGPTACFETTDLSFNQGYDTVYKFDFKKMKQINKDSQKQRQIRRVEDEDEDEDEDEEDEEEEESVTHTWEVQDDQGLWVPLYDADNKMLEAEYVTRQKTGKKTFSTKDLSFNKGYDSLYVFNFKEMTQTNSDSGNSRRLRRSKGKPKAWNIKNYGISGKKPATGDVGGVLAYPDYWSKPKDPAIDLVPVKQNSAEWQQVLAPFHSTLGRKPNIKSLERIQNYSLWPFYALQKDKMAKKNPKGVNEKNLFHGARVKANMDSIMNLGFDTRVSNAGSCGMGTYFAVNSRYSDGGYVFMDTGGWKHMFICKVLVGKFCRSPGSQTRRPPPLNPKKPEEGLYDSVVDNTQKPIMHVVFYDNQAIPEYIVVYK